MMIIQIVPRLFPAIDGLGDYALNLARQLHKDFKIATHFIVGDPTWSGSTQLQGFSVSQVTAQCPNNIQSLLLSDRTSAVNTVLLHYVGYGYAKRGCPLWLVNGLQRWRSEAKNRRLVTMFHELYAFGPPWTSSFWLSPTQRNLAARLAKMSDRCLTNLQRYAEILDKFSQGKHAEIPALPVFSNIGESKQVLPLANRHRRLVVFGGRRNRLQVYQRSWTELSYTCRMLEIEEIWDIGPSIDLTLPTIDSVSILTKGECSHTDISSVLSNSLAGFFSYYDPDRLAKSTIFAAYCAHGMLPISPCFSSLPVDGIEPGKQYWIPRDQPTELNPFKGLQAIADNAYAWYQSHNLSLQAKIFSAYLN